ncbi:hypothetical protein J7426_22970 [Tropicibacter sp. R16_0]|uniref:hypothetical protein n=1 Tax=Tropicibacter sp. R16_0 TaxID=2821102 RepID=UPI001AD9F5C9|nr:hypothetical protein [Tropicibacter sp. R16_0]MBO9453143.1 hypothetical protein [Tropicibacter sp. R16_0]
MNEDTDRQAAENARKRVSDYIAFANQTATGMSSDAIKAMLLLNGGAAVAMLGFVASVASQGSQVVTDLPAIVSALIWFAWGAGSAVFTSMTAYAVLYLQGANAASYHLSDHPPYIHRTCVSDFYKWCSRAMHLLAVLLGLVSIAAFGTGVYKLSDILLDPPLSIPSKN